MPSSMIVRSAVKLVSNTLSKPQRRRAVFISKVSGVPGSQAEALADGRARAGRGLDDDVLGRVVDGRPDLVGRVVGPQRAGRAAVDALAAVDADHVGQRLVHEGRDLGLVAAADGLQHADLLQVDAGADAAAAEDALVHVADDGVARAVDLVPRLRRDGRSGRSRRRIPWPAPAARSCCCGSRCSTRRSGWPAAGRGCGGAPGGPCRVWVWTLIGVGDRDRRRRPGASAALRPRPRRSGRRRPGTGPRGSRGWGCGCRAAWRPRGSSCPAAP